jgi:hypothetical protein
VWSYTFTSPYLMAWCLINLRNSFIFILVLDSDASGIMSNSWFVWK